MEKEMAWAKRSMEKHHRSKGKLPLRSPVSEGELYPKPDVDYHTERTAEDESSSSVDIAFDSVTLATQNLTPMHKHQASTGFTQNKPLRSNLKRDHNGLSLDEGSSRSDNTASSGHHLRKSDSRLNRF